MGVGEILERIKEEASAERERILREAEERAKEILEEAKTSLEKRRLAVKMREEKRGEEEKMRIIRSARLEARRIKWSAEQEITNEVFENAKKRIKKVKEEGFKGKSYEEILAGLVKEAAISISSPLTAGETATGETAENAAKEGKSEESEELEVLVSEEDANFVSQSLLDKISAEISKEEGIKIHLSLSPERIKASGGVIVRRKDGKVEVNNTFEKRMERFMPILRENVARILWK
ncbi:MAG: V-type ATP synthase subunit E family protein [Candidatus Methanospirare jalkutatii]|nr:MAG: V-type ATP synthase subunit E family protein [Candidatus Methanospirare jalkutatii]UYZ40698.1 MAG: V-type ATP synthase subunit E family protein [Candidatus Methanospirare jalkutatii]